MVKIKRENHETLVSMGSYETIFKPLGYVLVGNKKIVPEIGKSKVEIKSTVEETKTSDVKKKKKQEE